MYTIGRVEISHPGPGTLQVVKFRKAVIWNAVGVIFLVMWIGIGFWTWPKWNAWVRADERPWCFLRVGLLLLWPVMFLGLALEAHLWASRQARIYGERDVFVFAQERGTIERNGRLVARFADVATIEITVEDHLEFLNADRLVPTTHTLRVTLKDEKALEIRQVNEGWGTGWRQLSDLAQELANILGVELRYQTCI